MGRIVLLRANARPDAQIEHAAERRRKMHEAGLSPLARLFYEDLRASILTPAESVDYSQITALKMALRTRLQEQVARTTGQATLIRDLVPSDVSGAASAASGFAFLSNVNALVANTFFPKDIGFTKVGVNQAIGIFGFVQMTPAPKIQVIRFTQGASVPIAQFWLPPLYADAASNIGFFDPPVVWGPQQSIGIDLLASVAATAGSESYGLYGFACEIPGSTVMADQANLI